LARRIDAAMPWRRKPARHLEYWSGPVNQKAGFKTVLVYCMGPAELPGGYHSRCHHNGRLRLAELPPWDWYDISAHLKCTRLRLGRLGRYAHDWSEVIDFNKGIC
jgi:hypothetical protein